VAAAGVVVPAEALDRDDVQGLVVRGYGQLRAARYVLGEVIDAAAARAWLGGLAGTVSTGAQRGDDVALNIAFTAPGLERLGVSPRVREQFSREFLDGMTTEHRQRFLGDVEESAPAHWSWGGPHGDAVHVLLLVFARDEAAVAAELGEQEAAMRGGGIRPTHTLDTAELQDREHFGFRDGISQPRLAGLGPGPERDIVATGELVLGYPNAYGRYTPRPLVDDAAGVLPRDAEGSGAGDLGRNGTYLVLRQLSQDVKGFWDFCEEATRRPGGAVDEAARVRLAAKLVGRWPGGAPLALERQSDDPALAGANDFGYFAADRHGLGCPLGAHVRRANPRDTLDPAPGSARSVAVNNRHRLLRRGRKYGTLLPRSALLSAGTEAAWSKEERGLHFICLCANISRQFEFVQHSWLDDPRFNGLYDEPDPLMSPAPRGGRTFTVPAEPVRERYAGLPRFVSVRGGAYFFLPGVRTLRRLAGTA
jgi:Dyp-type peroxidase family